MPSSLHFSVLFCLFAAAFTAPLFADSSPKSEINSENLKYLEKLIECDCSESEKTLRRKFADELGIYVNKESRDVDPVLLAFLYKELKHYRLPPPTILYISDDEHARLVEYGKKGDFNYLSIARNAGYKLFEQNAKGFQDLIEKNPDVLNTNKIVFKFDYTNTLAEQLMLELLSDGDLRDRFEKSRGIMLGLPAEHPRYAETKDFWAKEMVAIEKQFLDLPEHVVKQLALKRIIRASEHWKDNNEASGLYYQQQNWIILADSAFVDQKNAFGEKTILHEIGHSYWATQSKAFKRDFKKLNWTATGAKVNPGSFVTHYARKNVEEDFAESFAAYVHRPKLLKKRNRKKYDFLNKKVFTDTEYYSTAPGNASIGIDSDREDTGSPYLSGAPEKSIKLKMIDGNGAPQISGSILGVFDDGSGLKEISLELTPVHYKAKKSKVGIRLYANLIKSERGTLPLGNPMGLYELTSGYLDLRTLPADDYQVSTLAIIDKAGNSITLSAEEAESKMGSIQVHIPGLQIAEKIVELDDIYLSRDLVTVEPAGESADAYEFVVEIDTPHLRAINGVATSWFASGKGDDSVVFDSKKTSDHDPLLSKAGDPKVRFKIGFPKSLPANIYNLSAMRFVFAAEGQFAEQLVTADLTGYRNVRVELGKTAKTGPQLNIDVNKLQISEIRLEKSNSKSGIKNIHFEVPITGAQSDRLVLSVAVRTPSDQTLSEILVAKGSGTYGKTFEIKTFEDGTKVASFDFELAEGHEGGTYMVESFYVVDEYAGPYQAPRNGYVDFQRGHSIKTIKVLERGIRKTLVIDLPKPDEKKIPVRDQRL